MDEQMCAKLQFHQSREQQERAAALRSAEPRARSAHNLLAKQHKMRALALICGWKTDDSMADAQ